MTDPRERMTLRPGELVGLAGVFGLFLGLITLMVTRDVIISLIAFGGTVVVGLVSLAMLMLAVTPNRPADGERQPETRND